MKNVKIIPCAALLSMMLGCATSPVAIAPVGPNPVAQQRRGETGQLLVYSAWQGHGEGNNPAFYQHSDYVIYDTSGRKLQRVENIVGHYAQSPRAVSLLAGKYVVLARAKGYGNDPVKVPVIIHGGQITRVHLDQGWLPPAASSKTELVLIPAGYPVGWRAGQN